MHTSKPIVQYIRDSGLKKKHCENCNIFDANTRCYYNEHFTNCPWTGNAMQWARELKDTWITVDIDDTVSEEVRKRWEEDE